MAAIEDMVRICRFEDWLSAKTAIGGFSERKWEDRKCQTMMLPAHHQVTSRWPIRSRRLVMHIAGLGLAACKGKMSSFNESPSAQGCQRLVNAKKGSRVLANSLAFGLFFLPAVM
jgi:hypothetical protein